MNNQPAPSSVDQPPSLVRVASDELLLLGARLHDDVALGVLYDRYGAEAYAVTLETLRESDAAEAAMQDAFLRIWRGVEIYDVACGTTRDWLMGLARGRALNALARLEPFGGVPEQVVSLDDTGLLAPSEPASGARERLLARAWAEGGSTRAADAPTVVIPAAEFGPEPATDLKTATDAELVTDAEPVSDDWPTVEAKLASDDELAVAAELAPGDEPTVETRLVPDDEPIVETVLTADEKPAGEAKLISDGEPAGGADPASDDRPTAETKLVSADDPDLDSVLASEAPMLTGLPIPPHPLSLNRQHIVTGAEALTQDVTLAADPVVAAEAVTEEVVLSDDPDTDAEPETQAVVMVTDPVVDAEAVTVAMTPVTDTDDDATDESPPSGRNLAELEPSEALAAALAPIPPRRPQQQVAPEPPRKGGVKLATIGWGVALLLVVASGLSVAAWSATGPHVSPDLNVLSRLPGGRIVTLRGAGTPTASARLHSVDSGRRSELSVDSLPPLPSGRVYQVWLIEPGQPGRSAGAFFVNRRGDAVVPVNLGGPVERLQAIAITQEPAPGTTAPTGTRVLEGTP